MIYLSIGLVCTATLLIVIALRGRVVSRGVFCRKCRFDLAGIDLHGDQPKCPECGRDVADQRATRSVLRHKRPIVLTLGGLLLLTGGSLLSILGSNNTARVLAVMPDRVVLTMHDMGFESAFTEIATNRLTRIPPLSDDTWAELIESALEHQANTNIVWDPRHGEVLLQAFTHARLSPEQIEQYFELGLVTFVDFQNEIRHGSESIGLKLEVQPDGRLYSLSGSTGSLTDGTDTVWNLNEIISGGVVDPAFETPMRNRGGYTSLHIPGKSGGGRGSVGGTIELKELDWDSIEPGQEYDFFIKYKMVVKRMSDGFSHYEREGILQQPVRVVPSDAQLVQLDTNPDTIARFEDHAAIRLAPLHILPVEKRRQTDRGVRLGQLGTICDSLPTVVAGRVIAIFEGHEYEIGRVGLDVLSGHGISSVQWTTEDPLPEPIIEAMLEAGSVTIEIRPDARLAERMPGVQSIFGLPIRFDDVIVTSEPIPSSQSSVPHPDQRTGRVVTDPVTD